MKRLVVELGKISLKLIYIFLKLIPTKNQIVFLSMQTDEISLDFQLLSNEIIKKDKTIKIVFVCKKMDTNLTDKSEYFNYIFKSFKFIFKAMYFLATSRVCVAESYCVPISILNHKKSLKIIQIWHASGGVKKFGYQIINKKEGKSGQIARIMCMHRNYDYVIAPSEETKKIYNEAFDVPMDKIVKFGLPRLEYLVSNKFDRTKEFYKENKNLIGKKIILYVPTFRKGKKSDLSKMLNYKLDKDKYKLIIKLHPLENNNVPDEYKISSKYSTYDLVKIADYIITDYSILSIEASVLNKPIFLYLYDIDEYEYNRGLNIDLNKELKTFVSNSFEDIMKKIKNKDYNMEEIYKYSKKYIEVDSNKVIEQLSEFVLDLTIVGSE